jgi:hypothetical protein
MPTTKKKMPRKPTGRPTSYSPEIVKKAKKYLDSCIDEERELGTDERPIYKIRVRLPTIEGLALFIGIHKDTIYEWEKIHKAFSDVIGDLRAEQAQKLIENGLSGDYNPTIAKVLLAKHGYKDAQEVDQNIKGSISLTDLFNKAKEE